MDASLCTQPPEISDFVVNDNGIANAQHANSLAATGAADKKKRKSKLKSHRQATSVLEATSYEVSPDQVAAALAESRARVASQQLQLAVTAGLSTNAPKNTTEAADFDNVVDLTGSSPTNKAKQNGQSRHHHTTQPNNKQHTPKQIASASNAVTPTPLQSNNSLVSTGETHAKKNNTLPTAPDMDSTTKDKEGRVHNKKLKPRDVNVPRISLDASDNLTEASCKQSPMERELKPPSDGDKSFTLDHTTHKANRVSMEGTHDAAHKLQHPLPTNVHETNTSSVSKRDTDKHAHNPSSMTNKSPPKTKTTTSKKKRSFHDQILYIMLTSCRPYSLKTLAKACDTTPEALHHAMLSFIDKQLVICKEFPGKKADPKKLYWANPMSMQEMNGKSAVCRELNKLFASAEDIAEAQKILRELQQRHRSVMEELDPILAIPTLQQLDQQIAQEEQQLKEVQSHIQAIHTRIELAANTQPSHPTAANHRFKKAPPKKPLDKTTLKRRINHMLTEYKTRKRQCMDFVEQLADAMEKKVKDVTGEKILALDTDEMEWKCWVDGATGKVNGVVKKSGGLTAKEPEEKTIVRLPAKYMDV